MNPVSAGFDDFLAAVLAADLPEDFRVAGALPAAPAFLPAVSTFLSAADNARLRLEASCPLPAALLFAIILNPLLFLGSRPSCPGR